MKKVILIIVSIFLITGCDSTEVFEKKCTQKINSENTQYTQNVKFIYNNEDEVLNIIVTNKYKSDDYNELELIKESAISYNNSLAKSDNIKIQILKDEDNEYKVRYNFNVLEMSEDELNQFDINKNWIKLNNKIKESDFECE